MADDARRSPNKGRSATERGGAAGRVGALRTSGRGNRRVGAAGNGAVSPLSRLEPGESVIPEAVTVHGSHADPAAPAALPPSPGEPNRLPRRATSVARPVRTLTPADDAKLFSIEPIQRWFRFTRHSLLRHPLLAVFALIVGLFAGSLLLLSSEPAYESSVSIVVREGSVLWNALDPNADSPIEPVRSSVEAALTKQSVLDNVIDEAGLLTREPKLGFFAELKNKITNLGTSESEAQRRAELRTKLTNSIFVSVPQDQITVSITVHWPDPDQALAIAKASEQTFFDDRRALEVAPLEDAIKILQEQADDATTRVKDERSSLGLGPLDPVPVGGTLESAVTEQRNSDAALRNAQLKLLAASTSFKSRYVELAPPELPAAPLSSTKIPIALAVVFGALVACAVCVGIDLKRKRVVETWQLDQHQLPVLATLSAGQLKSAKPKAADNKQTSPQ